MKAEDFPMLLGAARSAEAFRTAVSQIEEGVGSGAIRNVVLQDAKHTLSNAVYDAWRVQVSEPFFYAGRFEAQPEEVQALDDSILIMGLHDIVSASKKIERWLTKNTENDAVAAMRALCEEALPLAQAVASLKDKVVKGRAPAAPKSVSPNKLMGTCPVCFRSIAVQRGTMAHHGYTRPGLGWQTASCPGVRFRPLEVSNEGLVWLIGALRERLNGLSEAYARRDVHPAFFMGKRAADGRAEQITRQDPRWPRLFARHVAELQAEMQALEHEIPNLDAKLKAWRPIDQASPT